MALATTTSIVDYLKSEGKPSDYTYRSKLYKELGLESKYGGYVGAGQQNTGMINLLSSQKSVANQPAPATNSPSPQQQTIPNKVYKYQVNGVDYFQVLPGTNTPRGSTEVAPEQAITELQSLISKNNQTYIPNTTKLQFPTLSSEYQKRIDEIKAMSPQSDVISSYQTPWGETLTNTKQSTIDEIQKKEEAVKAGTMKSLGNGLYVPTGSPASMETSILNGSEVNSSYQYTAPTAKDLQGIIEESIGTSDLSEIIGDVSSGNITTPELELSKEDKDAQLAKLKTDTASALQTLQQNLASRGMTFSGVRTVAEEKLAADSLAEEAGISRDFAEDNQRGEARAK